MTNIYFVFSFRFLAALISTVIDNKFYLPKHLIEKPILDDQMQDIGKKENKLLI